MSNDDIDSVPSITLDQDDIAARQPRASRRRAVEEIAPATPGASQLAPAKRPPMIVIAIVLLTVLLIAAQVAIVFLYKHLSRAEADLVAATGRIEQLEHKLTSTDTTITKSEVVLAAKIKSIDGALDANKADIRHLTTQAEQHRRLTDSHTATLQKLQPDLQAVQAQAKQTADLAANQREQIKTLDASTRENNQRVEMLQETVNELSGTTKTLSEKQNHLDADLGKRMNTLEDNAKSNDVFRRNTNDELARIKDMLTKPAAAK